MQLSPLRTESVTDRRTAPAGVRFPCPRHYSAVSSANTPGRAAARSCCSPLPALKSNNCRSAPQATRISLQPPLRLARLHRPADGRCSPRGPSQDRFSRQRNEWGVPWRAPVRLGSKTTPSNGRCVGRLAPAAASIPPNPFVAIGTRMPPSYKANLSPRNGAFRAALRLRGAERLRRCC
jgi:hypothetical protein